MAAITVNIKYILLHKSLNGLQGGRWPAAKERRSLKAAVHRQRLRSPPLRFPATDRSSHRGTCHFLGGSCPVSGPAATAPIDDDNLITFFQPSGPLGRPTDVQANVEGQHLSNKGLRAITVIYSTRDCSNGSPQCGRDWRVNKLRRADPLFASLGSRPDKASKWFKQISSEFGLAAQWNKEMLII